MIDMLPITRQISSYNHSSGNDIKYIVMHYTGNDTDSASGNANYFNGGDRQASAHYFVDNNSIYQVVEDYNAAWHCGDGHGSYGISNHNSIGIEMCCNNRIISDTTENNAIELVKYLMTKYNIDIDHIVRHYDASRKICPNWQSNNWERWTNFKNKLINSSDYEYKEDENTMISFSEDFYTNTYSDVEQAIKNGDFKNGYEHYIQYGKAEGRKPLPDIPSDFSVCGYIYCNPDLEQACKNGLNPINHYLTCGWRENRKWSLPQDNVTPKEDNSNKEVFYRVVTGSYKERNNAEEQIKKLKDSGFDSFIDVYKK